MRTKQKILIVDDDLRNQRIILEVLEDLFECKTAANGEQALAESESLHKRKSQKSNQYGDRHAFTYNSHFLNSLVALNTSVHFKYKYLSYNGNANTSTWWKGFGLIHTQCREPFGRGSDNFPSL